MKNGKIVLVILWISALTSCAVGRKLSFENKTAGPDYKTSKSATVVFVDYRPEIISGKQKPSLCGHVSSTAQISYNIQTKSGRPLADEFAESVSATYAKNGAASSTIFAIPNADTISIVQAFKSANNERLLLFKIKKWDSRVMPLWSTIKYQVLYDLELNLFDKDGNLLAYTGTHDILENEIKAGAVNVSKLQEMSDELFNEQIRKLFAAEGIKKNL